MLRRMKRERQKAAGKKRLRMRASYTNPPTDFRVAIDMSYDDLMDDKVCARIAVVYVFVYKLVSCVFNRPKAFVGLMILNPAPMWHVYF